MKVDQAITELEIAIKTLKNSESFWASEGNQEQADLMWERGEEVRNGLSLLYSQPKTNWDNLYVFDDENSNSQVIISHPIVRNHWKDCTENLPEHFGKPLESLKFFKGTEENQRMEEVTLDDILLFVEKVKELDLVSTISNNIRS